MRASPESVADEFGLDLPPELEARYNIAPGQPVAVIRAEGSRRVCALHSWGLIPAWAKDPSIGNRLINARAETIAEKPAFRGAFRARRCLIPADGFYEWSGTEPPKQPVHVARTDGALFALAGLWESWISPDGEEIRSCTIVTTVANAVVRPIHQRMPVIVDPQAYAPWLETEGGDLQAMRALLAPCPETWLSAWTVGIMVNDVRNDGPECVLPAAPAPTQGSLL